MTEPLKKVTEFMGRASGDCECFCFDKRSEEQAEIDRKAYNEARALSWALEMSKPYDPDAEDDYDWSKDPDTLARIYPHDLLPEGHKTPETYEEHTERSLGGQSIPGKWRITVEFWPDPGFQA